ncbi:SDR family NAD(P)-dependent oxidoreductase [Nocardia sp. 348MFTsu5.1]|uniref:SDR family NAD(P)-dependent oxidoreductase n=1 Tax=Nocardia sp. 348MFTsu5.1 TaxID=1172185 RepID=UPI00037B3164|nr:SDR family oxidoreductase [Nocardia sp. 348MFTsu5.1]
MDLGFTGASAVVAGGGRGMGLAVARCLAEEGARVAVLARTPADLESAVAALTAAGSPDAVGLVADVGDQDRVTEVFAELGERWDGRLNALINATGPNVQGDFGALTDDDWQAGFDDGVMGMVHTVRSALPLLRNAEWARVVNFSAGSTQRQSVRLPAYTAAKAMVTSISKNLSLYLAPDEIMVNVISPGSVASDSLIKWAKSVGVDSDDPYQLMAAIDKHFGHPAHLPRAGLPDEIARVATFLASRANSYMTGANVNVDGGTDFT